MLLTVAERTAVSHDAHTQQVVALRHLEGEVHGCRASFFRGEALLLLRKNLVRQGVEERQRRSALHRPLRQVVDGGSHVCLISHPHETRQIGRQHEFLAGGGGTFQQPGQHVLRMSISAEVPTGQALRSSEREDQLAQLVRPQLRIEESRLGKVGAQAFQRLDGALLLSSFKGFKTDHLLFRKRSTVCIHLGLRGSRSVHSPGNRLPCSSAEVYAQSLGALHIRNAQRYLLHTIHGWIGLVEVVVLPIGHLQVTGGEVNSGR